MTEVLDLASRRRIFEFLEANPGVHLRLIGKVLGMSTGMLSYHLNVMERRGLLQSEEEGHRKRYFSAAAFAEAQRRIIAILRQDVPGKIVVEILLHRERTFAQLQAAVGVSKSTLSYHLKKMLQREVLVRDRRERGSLFRLRDPEEVARLLLANLASLRTNALSLPIDNLLRFHV